MNRISLTLCFFALFIFNSTNGYARQDSLLLYTKPGCSNCQAAKLALRQSGISYAEKSLDNNDFASEMLHKLSTVGYHEKIYLPVIFLNNKLYHPAYKSDTGMVSIPLQDVVDSIKKKFQRGELNLPIAKLETPNNNELPIASSDCELKTTPIYLICANYNTEEEAKTVMNKLISGGYIYAGIVYSQKQYRVFCKIFTDYGVANSDLNVMKKTYKDAYLLEMP